MIAYETNFRNWYDLTDKWATSPPWGTSNGLQGVCSSAGLSIVPDGLMMSVPKNSAGQYLMPRIFWKGAPFSYGLFEAEMTVPTQRAVCTFVLYSLATYKKGLRSLMPEIDIAEHGVHNHPDKLNHAVHEWIRRPDFEAIPGFKYEDRNKYDYNLLIKKQKSRQTEWKSSRRKFTCEITRWGVKIWVNGVRTFTRIGRIDASFTPTFGISVPTWIKNPDPKYMIIHSLKIDQ